MDQGFLKLWRALKDKSIWKNSSPVQKTILVTLLMMANWQENEWDWQGERFYVKPGEVVTSLHSIAEEAGKGVSVQNVRTALLRFQKLEFLTNRSTNHGRVITIINWDSYQVLDNEANKPTNKHLTSNQQAPNKHLTPIEEGKKVRKKEVSSNEDLKEYKFPNQEEIDQSAIPKIQKDIKEIADILYRRKEFLKVFAFVNKMHKEKKNPRAILHTLCRCSIKKPGDKEAWGYCISIIKVEDGNYYERDHQKTT